MNLYINEAESRLKSAIAHYEKIKDAIGIHLSLSKLNYNIKDCSTIAINVLRDQFKSTVGDIYLLNNGDIIIVYRGRNEKLVHDCLYQVYYLFSADDENNQYSTHTTEFIEKYSQVYYPHEWLNFINLCEKLVNSSGADKNDEFKGSIISLFSSIIEDLLITVDWKSLVKSSAIVKYSYGDNTSKIFDEIHIDDANLTFIIGENFDISNNPYLKSYLKEFLDLKLLVNLIEHLNNKPSEDNAYLLNLNITTLSSPEFWALADSLPASIKKRIIISISIGDVFSDMLLFVSIREKISNHYFKMCLDCNDYLSFLQIDRSSLRFDLIRIKHNNTFDINTLLGLEELLSNKINLSGASRIIVEVENEKSMALAQNLGVLLFQVNN